MFAHAVGLAALLAFLPMPAFAEAVIGAAAGQQAAGRTDDHERIAAERAGILAGANATRLETCRDLVRDLYRWGVLDNLATGIAFGLINNTTRIARRAEVGGDDRLRRGSADFVIGSAPRPCTSTWRIETARKPCRAWSCPTM